MVGDDILYIEREIYIKKERDRDKREINYKVYYL